MHKTFYHQLRVCARVCAPYTQNFFGVEKKVKFTIDTIDKPLKVAWILDT